MAQQLLAELSALPHPQRVRRMVDLGKASRSSPQAAALIAELSATPGHLAQQCVLYACLGSREMQPALSALSGSSKSLRELAQSVLCDVTPAHLLPQVLLQQCGYAATAAATPGKLPRVLTSLRRRPGRVQAVAHVVHGVVLLVDPAATYTAPMQQEQEQHEEVPVPLLTDLSLAGASDDKIKLLSRVLPYGNEQQVMVILAKLEAKLSGMEDHVDLPLLIRYHARVCVEFLARQHHTTRYRLLTSTGVWPALMQHAPDGALSLFSSLPADTRARDYSLWEPLTIKFPERMMELLLTLTPAPLDDYCLHGYLQRAQAARRALAQQRAAAAAIARTPAAPAPAPAAATNTTTGTGGAAADGSAPPPPAEDSMSVDGASSAGSQDGEGDGADSWVAPTSVPSVASLLEDEDAVMAGANEGEQQQQQQQQQQGGAGGGGGDVGARRSGPHAVFELSARKKLLEGPFDSGTYALHRKRLQDAALSDAALLQACYAMLRHLPKVLRALPVARRVSIFKMWVAWLDQQASLLEEVKASLAAQGDEAVSEYEKVVLKHLQEQNTELFKNDSVALNKWLPVQCQVELVQALLTRPIFKGHPAASTLALAVMSRLPSEQLLALLQQLNAQGALWGNSTTGTARRGDGAWQVADGVLPLLRRLSAAQQSRLLLDGRIPARDAQEYTLRTVAALRPRTDVLEMLTPLTYAPWTNACKLLAGKRAAVAAALSSPSGGGPTAGAGSGTGAGGGGAGPAGPCFLPGGPLQAGEQDEVPPPGSPQLASSAVRGNVLRGLLEALGGEDEGAVGGLLLRCTPSTLSAPCDLATALQGFTRGLEVRQGVIDELYQRWRAERRPPLLSSTTASSLSAHLARLAGPPSTPQHALHQALGLAIQLEDASLAYAPWLDALKPQRGASFFPAYWVHRQDALAGEVLAAALGPDARAALLLDAAADLHRLRTSAGWDVPASATTTGVAAALGTAGGAAGAAGGAGGAGLKAPLGWAEALDLVGAPGRLLKRLLDRGQSKALLAGLSGEQVKGLCDALPGLWTKAPWVLRGLSSPDRVAVMTQLRTTRASVQDALARLLNAGAPLPAPAALPAATTPAATTPTVVLPATAAASTSTSAPAPMQEDGGAEEGGATRGVEDERSAQGALAFAPNVSLGLAGAAKGLLGARKDAVLRELVAPPSSEAAAGGLVATVEEKAALDALIRDVVLAEEMTVPMKLLPPHVRAMVARARILRATEKHHGPLSHLFHKVELDLCYLTWREITEAPCFKDRLQSREASERGSALLFLINAVKCNPELLPHLLTAMHHRRREQDDTRSMLLAGLSAAIRDDLVPAAFERQLQALVASHLDALVEPLLPARHQEVSGLKAAAVAAATRAAVTAGSKGLLEDEEAQRRSQLLLASLPGLSQVIRDALSARDLSRESMEHLRSMAFSMLRAAPEWAAQQLALLASHGGSTALPVEQLQAAWTELLEAHSARCQVVRTAVAVAVEEGTAGLPEAMCKLPKELEAEERTKREEETARQAAAAAGLRPKRRRGSRQTHKGARAAAVKAAVEAQRKPLEPFLGASDPLQEAVLLSLGAKLLPGLIAAFGKRQDGLFNTLRLVQRWSEELFSLGPRKRGVVDVGRLLRPQLDALLLALVEPVAALRDAAALDGAGAAGEAASVALVAWFADQVLLNLPDHYPQLHRLMLPTDRTLAQLVKPHVLNSLTLSWPAGRLDLLLPLMLDNTSMPEVAAKATRLLFQFHGRSVATVVPQLLARDPTYIMLPKVFWFVMRHRQDLLPALTTTAAPAATATTTRPAAAAGAGAGAGAPAVVPVKGLFSGGTPSGMVASTQARQALRSAKKKGPGGAAIKRRGAVRATRGGRGGGKVVACRPPRGGGGGRVNLGGWSKSGLTTSLWLGTPTLSLRSASKLSPAAQQLLGQELVGALQSQGKLDVSIVRRLVKKLAALPALPAHHLLALLDAAMPPPPAGGSSAPGPAAQRAGTGAAGGAVAAAGEAEEEDTGREAVQDVVLSALVKLDDGSQAWDALVEALSKGTSNTALAAINTLLAADIRALAGGDASTATTTTAAASTSTATTAATTSLSPGATSGAAQLLHKLRQLPWQRPAALRVVIKLLGQLSQRSALAWEELRRLVCYVTSGLKQAAFKDEKVAAEARQVVAEATPAALAALDTGVLPLPAGKELHRSAHLQLLVTLQDHFALPEVQAVFLASALAEDKEIAKSAAWVPGKALQKSAPGTVAGCAKVFELLLRHPDKEVRMASMKAWAGSDNLLRLEAGLPVIVRMLSVKRKNSAEFRAAKRAAGKWFQRAIESESEATLQRGGARARAVGGYGAMMPMMAAMMPMAKSAPARGASEDDEDDEDDEDEDDEGGSSEDDEEEEGDEAGELFA